jgi:hypothetical protein
MTILTRILKEKHRRAGLYLEEDDHVVRLMRGQKRLEVWLATTVPIKEIQREADRHIGFVLDDSSMDPDAAFGEATNG